MGTSHRVAQCVFAHCAIKDSERDVYVCISSIGNAAQLFIDGEGIKTLNTLILFTHDKDSDTLYSLEELRDDKSENLSLRYRKCADYALMHFVDKFPEKIAQRLSSGDHTPIDFENMDILAIYGPVGVHLNLAQDYYAEVEDNMKGLLPIGEVYEWSEHLVRYNDYY